MTSPPVLTPTHLGRTVLPDWGVIRASGEDAATFLQGQLTQDVLLAPLGEWRLAAYCSPKGRMLASFWVVKTTPTELLLVCHKDLLEATLKRLRMFVLRAKVVLSDATTLYRLEGCLGPEAMPSVVPADGALGVWPTIEGVARALFLAPLGTPEAAGEAVAADMAPTAPVLLAWQWLLVRSGVSPICLATSDLFVPQMLNYESVGGVNFKKGCYPGQEVVARSQFRGTLKRRACVVHADEPLQPGQDVWGDDPEQPCGTVAYAAPSPHGGWDAVVSLQLVALEGDGLFADMPKAVRLSLLPLPYPLLEI